MMESIDQYLGKVIQGDCIDVMRRLPDKCVDLILTDIPYGEVNRESNGLRVLDKGDADSVNFNLILLAVELGRVCSGSIYVFCGTEQVSELRRGFVNLGMSTRLIIWEKTNPSPMNGEHIWLSGLECCVYGKFSGAAFNRKCVNSVLRYPCGSSKFHPTEKPLSLIQELVETSSNETDLIFDPFCGSGSTLVAAEQLGRRWFGCEISPAYCEIAEARIKAAQSGLTVAELKNGQKALFEPESGKLPGFADITGLYKDE